MRWQHPHLLGEFGHNFGDPFISTDGRKSDVAGRLFDHLGDKGKHRRWNCKANGLSRLLIDHELVFCR
jgi:hypothetical protein